MRLTHDEALRVGQLLEQLPEVFISLLVRGAQNLRDERRESETGDVQDTHTHTHTLFPLTLPVGMNM